MNFVFYRKKIKFISSSRRVIFFLLYRQENFCTNTSVKVGNDVIDILTSEDMSILVPRGRDPCGQRHGSRPLAGAR